MSKTGGDYPTNHLIIWNFPELDGQNPSICSGRAPVAPLPPPAEPQYKKRAVKKSAARFFILYISITQQRLQQLTAQLFRRFRREIAEWNIEYRFGSGSPFRTQTGSRSRIGD